MCISGEYVTLYQQQRSAMRQRANEREGYIYQLARERVDMQGKLGELQSLVVKLLGERNLLHSYHVTSTAPAPAASPNTPPPTKRRRHAKRVHSDDTSTDGMSSVIASLVVISKHALSLSIVNRLYRMQLG